MSNLLAIPFKRAYMLNVKDAARRYLLEHGDTHPDAVKSDINEWHELRQKVVGMEAHVDRINVFLRYHAQLTSILTKLPVDIQLEIAYAPAFTPSAIPITMNNLVFERAAVVFNLGALYSQLAASENRSNGDGIKRAVAYYQNASGSMAYLRTAILPKFVTSSEDEQKPLDLLPSFVHALEWLMLAQAQECFWQKAKIDNYKNGLVAKLAASTASLYKMVLTTIQDASPPIKHIFPSEWLAHIEVKQCHFDGVAQYRKSRDELEGSRYGSEIAYLTQALTGAKKGYDVARRGGVSPAVLHDLQSFLDAVQKDVTRAERDNDLIYHQDVPTASSLPPIQHAAIAQVIVPKELLNPSFIVENDEMLFSELLGWGAQEAINLYNDRKKNLIQDQMILAAQETKDAADKILHSLNLPASLEALERPVGLPPSLLKKAEQVRLENGPNKIEAAIKDIHRLARQNSKLLNDAMDILDQEASEDESTRGNMTLDRLPSHEANAHLVEKERRYRGVLEQAAASDETVRTKWDQWERNITELTWDEADLERSIPLSNRQTQSKETETHARALRSLLESLDELHSDRENLVQRAQRLAEADDIQPRILKAASGFERLADVQPVMFEDVSDEELAKYDKFLKWMRELEPKQEEILSSITRENELFLQSRREDDTIKERERALQSLDLSYHKYQEIVHNLVEGVKFYNDLIGILMQFKETCKQWSNERKLEIHSLSQPMQSLSISDDDDEEEEEHSKEEEVDEINNIESPTAPSAPTHGQVVSLPSLSSGDWGWEASSSFGAPFPGPAHRSRKA